MKITATVLIDKRSSLVLRVGIIFRVKLMGFSGTVLNQGLCADELVCIEQDSLRQARRKEIVRTVKYELELTSRKIPSFDKMDSDQEEGLRTDLHQYFSKYLRMFYRLIVISSVFRDDERKE